MKIRSMELGGLSGHEAGLHLLGEMYRQEIGATIPEICRTQRGKPYFKDSDVHFSISHTPRRVFCVLSDKPVGIDAEEIDRKANLRLADKILSPTEKEEFLSAEDKNEALLKFWVLKEALVKCTGEGLRGYPNQTAFSLADERLQILDNCCVAVIEE